MHSSTMRTARSSSRLPGGLPQCMLGYTALGLETLPVWAWNPPGCRPGVRPPPHPDPPTSLFGVGLETPRATSSQQVDLCIFFSGLSGGPFIFNEVIDLGHEPIKATEYTHLGRVTEFKYSQKIGFNFRG